MARFDPTRPDFSPYGFSCVHWTPTEMPRGDRHNEIELNLLDGREAGLSHGREKGHRPGRAVDRLLGGCFASDRRLRVPDRVFRRNDSPGLVPPVGSAGTFSQPILHGETHTSKPDEEHLASDRQRFELWSEDVRGGSAERRHASLLEVEARLRRLALSARPRDRDGNRGVRGATRPPWRTSRFEPGGADGLLHRPELHAAVDRRDDRPTRGPAPQLCDVPVPADFRHHADEVRHSATAVTRATAAPDHQRLMSQHRVRFGVRLAQPLQRGVPAILRLHAEPLSPIIFRHCVTAVTAVTAFRSETTDTTNTTQVLTP